MNVEKTIESLKSKGYDASIVESGSEALEKIKSLVPKNSSVMNGSSVTLEQIGFVDYLKSGKSSWNNLHEKVLSEKDPAKQGELRKLTTISDYYLGSVHALIENGEFLIASNTGSQIPSIVFNSKNLIFVVSTKKIVPDLQAGIERIEKHIIPLEDTRMNERYGVGTHLNKLLIFKGENPIGSRKITFILVKEDLGF